MQGLHVPPSKLHSHSIALDQQAQRRHQPHLAARMRRDSSPARTRMAALLASLTSACSARKPNPCSRCSRARRRPARAQEGCSATSSCHDWLLWHPAPPPARHSSKQVNAIEPQTPGLKHSHTHGRI